jgi:hypothetical protein
MIVVNALMPPGETDDYSQLEAKGRRERRQHNNGYNQCWICPENGILFFENK